MCDRAAAAERAIKDELPLLMVTCSGGATPTQLRPDRLLVLQPSGRTDDLRLRFLAAGAVFMLAQGLGIVIYVRNLILIYRRRIRYQRRRMLSEQTDLSEKSLAPAEADDKSFDQSNSAAASAPTGR